MRGIGTMEWMTSLDPEAAAALLVMAEPTAAQQLAEDESKWSCESDRIQSSARRRG